MSESNSEFLARMPTFQNISIHPDERVALTVSDFMRLRSLAEERDKHFAASKSQNEDITSLQAELASYKLWAEVEIADLRDDVKRLSDELAAKLEELKLWHAETGISLDDCIVRAILQACAEQRESRKWVGLTNEERLVCTGSPFTDENYRAIEAKLKEKNT